MQRSDIRGELGGRIAELEQQVSELRKKRDEISLKLQTVEEELRVWRTAYLIEDHRLGESGAILFAKGGKLRFAGMKLTNALAIVRKEYPHITKRQAAKMLEAEGFDFRGKRQVNAVHFAWVALDRRKK